MWKVLGAMISLRFCIWQAASGARTGYSTNPHSGWEKVDHQPALRRLHAGLGNEPDNDPYGNLTHLEASSSPAAP